MVLGCRNSYKNESIIVMRDCNNRNSPSTLMYMYTYIYIDRLNKLYESFIFEQKYISHCFEVMMRDDKSLNDLFYNPYGNSLLYLCLVFYTCKLSSISEISFRADSGDKIPVI